MKEPQSLDLRVKQFTLTRSNSTSALRCTLPMNAYIVDIVCHTYATSAGAQLDVGTVGNDDAFVAALDVSAAQINRGTVLTAYTALTAMTGIYAHIQGSPVAGGPFRVEVIYTTPKSTTR